MRIGPLVALAALLLLAGCGGGATRAGRSPSPSATPSSSGSSSASSTPSVTPSAPVGGDCRGIRYDDVRGAAPAYGPRALRYYRADRAVCAAYWLPQSDDLFIGQSLAIEGQTAYVGGYRWAPTYSKRPCQIAVLDLATGRETAFQPRFEASIYHPRPTYCRHGGGMDLGTDGLWVQETKRLWLLDPAKVGHGDPVRRWWRMGPGLRGSAMVIRGGRLGVASFRGAHPGRIFWFRISDLLRPGVHDLVLSGDAARSPGRPVARSVADVVVPRLLQGVAPRPGGLWYSTSGGGCAQLVAPGGHRSGFVPGSEDLQFVGDKVYVVSEAGARPYVRGTRKRMVPVLTELDRARMLATRTDCTQ